MATKAYDLAVKTGEYTDRNGQTKGRWLNVGSVMKTDDGGQFIMLNKTFNPAGVPDLQNRGGDSVLLSMFEPKQYDGGGQQQAAPQQKQPEQNTPPPADDFDDDIPF